MMISQQTKAGLQVNCVIQIQVCRVDCWNIKSQYFGFRVINRKMLGQDYLNYISFDGGVSC